ACIGKWHLGMDWTLRGGIETSEQDQETVDYSQPINTGPNEVGFDYFFGTAGCTTDDPPLCFIENHSTVGIPAEILPHDFADENRKLRMVPGWRHEDADFEFMNKTLTFIENEAKRKMPFFVYLPLSVPYIPWLAHEDFKGKSGAGPRGDQVLMADKIVGEISRKLSELKIADNTLLIFTSDNGAPWSENDKLIYAHQSNWSARGQKADIWNGGHRVPLFMEWPARIINGVTCTQTVGLIDIIATLSELTGEEIENGYAEDSYSFFHIINGSNQKPVREDIIYYSSGGRLAIQSGEWKYIDCLGSGGFTKPSRLEPVEGGPKGQLYNLHQDPLEQNNLYLEKPVIVKELSGLLDSLVNQ
ncbi:MAG: sulfatase-like hydrolase/transferase, partial [Bacteroidales bacterium]|nr:sulfatase-like hydrolase/transferase [Bacteroidales bacterium]